MNWANYVDGLIRSRSKPIRAFAKDLGMGVQTLYAIRRGEQNPNCSTIAKIAAYQNISEADLWRCIRGETAA